MKVLVLVAVAAVALLAIVLLVGWALPVRHRVAREATYQVSVDSLYATLTDVEAFPSWRSNVQRVDALPAAEGRRSYREVGAGGALSYVVEEAVPPRRLVTRIADRGLPFGGRWTYELTPTGGGATLRVTEDGEVYNPLYRFVSRFVLGHDTTIERYLRDLEARLAPAPRAVS